MNTRISCDKCQATAWTHYTEYDPSVNAYEVETEDITWMGGDPLCSHENFTILSSYDLEDPSDIY